MQREWTVVADVTSRLLCDLRVCHQKCSQCRSEEGSLAAAVHSWGTRDAEISWCVHQRWCGEGVGATWGHSAPGRAFCAEGRLSSPFGSQVNCLPPTPLESLTHHLPHLGPFLRKFHIHFVTYNDIVLGWPKSWFWLFQNEIFGQASTSLFMVVTTN